MEVATRYGETIGLIRQSARAVTESDGRLQRIRALRFDAQGFSPVVWKQMCELGWMSLLVPEAEGGSGLGMQALCALLEELGRALVPEPLFQGAVVAPFLSGQALKRHLSGASIVLLAAQEEENDLEKPPQTRLQSGKLNGRKTFVPMAAGASAFVVSTHNGLALVDRSAVGLTLDVVETQDGGHFGVLTFRDSPAISVHEGDTTILDEAAMAVSAYLLGVMDKALDLTVQYLRVRTQFGRPIGAFQALQHKAAEMKMLATVARASIEGAAATLDSNAPISFKRAAVSRAKARAAEASLQITKDAIQLHGAIGYTDEHDIGLFLKKTLTLCNLYGSATVHRARYVRLLPEDEND